MKLKSRSSFPPQGWRFFQPETGWEAPFPLANSFDQQVQNIIAHRRNNPRFNLSTDPVVVANQLERFTAYRLKGDPNWVQFGPEDQAQKKTSQPPAAKERGFLAQLVQGVRTSQKGSEILAEWIGEGGLPTSRKEAELRAKVCEACPLNE